MKVPFLLYRSITFTTLFFCLWLILVGKFGFWELWPFDFSPFSLCAPVIVGVLLTYKVCVCPICKSYIASLSAKCCSSCGANFMNSSPEVHFNSPEKVKKDFKELVGRYEAIDAFMRKWRILIYLLLSAGISFYTYFYHPSGGMELLESIGLGLLFGLAAYKLLSAIPYALFLAYFKCPNCREQLPSIYSVHPTSVEYCQNCNAKLKDL